MKAFSTNRGFIQSLSQLIQFEAESGYLEDVCKLKFQPEARCIVDVAQSLGCTTYVDLGCWYGLLAREVVAADSAGLFRRIIAVDAVQQFVDQAKQLIVDRRAEFLCHTLLTQAVDGTSEWKFRVHTGDSSESGILLDEGLLITSGPAVTIDGLLRKSTLSPAETYLKIDVEGLDSQLITETLAAGFYPSVFHFEYLPWLDYEAAFTSLRQAGYSMPNIPGQHRYYSIVSAREQCRVIGFEPTYVYI